MRCRSRGRWWIRWAGDVSRRRYFVGVFSGFSAETVPNTCQADRRVIGRGYDCRLDDPHDGRNDRAIEDQTENGDPQVWVALLRLEVARQVARQRWEDAKQDGKQR